MKIRFVTRLGSNLLLLLLFLLFAYDGLRSQGTILAPAIGALSMTGMCFLLLFHSHFFAIGQSAFRHWLGAAWGVVFALTAASIALYRNRVLSWCAAILIISVALAAIALVPDRHLIHSSNRHQVLLLSLGVWSIFSAFVVWRRSPYSPRLRGNGARMIPWLNWNKIIERKSAQVVPCVRMLRVAVYCAGVVFSSSLLLIGAFSHPQTTVIRAVVSLERSQGKVLWLRELAEGPGEDLHKWNSNATPTALADDEHVYAYFGNLRLHAANLQGQPVWQNTNLPFRSHFGLAVSPLLVDGIVIVSSGTQEDRYVAGIKANTGTELWRQKRKPNGLDDGENRTPVIRQTPAGKTVVIVDKNRVLEYRVQNGRVVRDVLLKVPDRWGSMVASALVIDEMLYIPAEIGIVVAYRMLPQKTSGRQPALWIAREEGPDCSSPVAPGDQLCFISETGSFTCIDRFSGKKLLRLELNGQFYSSLAAAGKFIYATNNEGETTVISPGTGTSDAVASFVPRPVFASLAFFDEQVFIRDELALYCFTASQR